MNSVSRRREPNFPNSQGALLMAFMIVYVGQFNDRRQRGIMGKSFASNSLRNISLRKSVNQKMERFYRAEQQGRTGLVDTVLFLAAAACFIL